MSTDDRQLEIETEDSAPEIEIIDDTPEVDRNKTPKGEVEVTDDEISQYSENVQKRIKDLRRAYHDERREKERMAREQNEALSYAEKLQRQNRELQERLLNGEKYLVETTKAKTESELTQAEREYKEAYESGDADKLIAAQRRVSELIADKREVDRYKPAYTPLQEEEKAVETQLPKIVPDERTRQWVSQNEWFEKDHVMRSAAFSIHDELVRSGYVAGSDAYFERVDTRIREEFPHKFAARRPAANVVAPASRSTTGSRKYVLTKSQVAIAKRLGVPLEKYAEYASKESNNV